MQSLSSNLQLGLLEGTLARKREHMKVYGFLKSHTDTAEVLALRVASCREQM